MKRIFGLPLFAAAVSLAATQAGAACNCAARYGSDCADGAVMTTDGGVCEAPHYHTIYRTERSVVMDRVEETRFRTVFDRVPEQHVVNYTTYATEQRQKQVNYTVMVPSYETKTRSYTVNRPVWETRTREINYTVMKPVYETKTRSYTVHKPVYETRTREINYTVRKAVPYTKTITVNTGSWQTQTYTVPGRSYSRTVRTPGRWVYNPATCSCCYQPGSCCKICCTTCPTTCCKRVWVPSCETREICCTKYVCEPRTKTCCYTVCTMVPECKTCSYQVCRMVPECRTKTCCYKVCTMVPECKTCSYQVCRMVPECRTKTCCYTVCVPKCCQRTVTTYKCVPRQVPYTVTKCVPRTVCKQIPCKVLCTNPACPEIAGAAPAAACDTCGAPAGSCGCN